MKKLFATAALSALLFTGVAAVTATPAEAQVSVGFYVGDGGYYGPRDHWRYRRHYEPVYYDGYWYRDPYYRYDGRRRLYWINNGWRYDSWHGPRPRHIEWRRHRGWDRHDGYRRHWR